MYPPVESPETKLSISKVEIEELGCDLMAGVRISPLEAVRLKETKIPSWPQVFATPLTESNWLNGEVGVFNLTLESYVKDNKVKPDEVWCPFTCQYLEVLGLEEAKFISGGQKTQKVLQRFRIKLTPPESEPDVPYLQFYCGVEWSRYMKASFKQGDLVTLVMQHPKYPLHWPKPPIITVVPTAEQTFVPMMSKQRMVLVTSKEDQCVEFKDHPSGTIKHFGSLSVDFGRECNYFHCSRPSPSSEIIFVQQKKKPRQNRKVVVPFCEKDPRFPIILNPLKNSVLYANSIDGFVIRFWKENAHPVVVSGDTPVKSVFTKENTSYIERCFEIDKRRPFFYLEKKDHSWVIT